ncbi:hypothetical protein VE03_06032 [Pseudogymnoascus sp. 23342-1-I1]|nr:hypothetical protein VE03_06032 [Pseudogymnoascus sp. 23342-1-I1]
MSATVMGHYSSDTRDLSPDAMAAAYPDRPIRPMPKRRLRERLSPNVADAIVYPPTAPAIAPLFHYPYHAPTEEERSPKPYPVSRTREDDVEHNYISRRNLKEVDSDEEYTELAYRSRYSRHSPDPTGRAYRFVQKPDAAKYPKPDPPASTTSSADGYDSFENTNNKKKRKIPTPGDAISNGILQANDMASLTISTPTTEEPPVREESSSGPGQYYGPPVSNLVQGLSGPGRGRYGRVRSGRSPLRNLSDNPTNWANGRTPRQRQAPWSPGEPAGIISTAIANAESNTSPVSRGQENMSLLQEQAARKSSSTAAQFTFTCDSRVPGTVAWPRPQAPPHQGSGGRPTNTHGTQTSPPISNGSLQRQGNYDPSQAHNFGGRQGAVPKKNRRSAGKEYQIAARQRREQQELQNYHHPLAPEDEWICEFCEYERIFGTPPEALIRQYEMKDRRIRKQEAERRRLLEKAKMKGRKSKKGTKPGAKNAAATQDRQAQGGRQASGGSSHAPHGAGEKYYYNDDDYDGYAQDDNPPSPTYPLSTPGQQKATYNHDEKHTNVQGGAGNSEALAS